MREKQTLYYDATRIFIVRASVTGKYLKKLASKNKFQLKPAIYPAVFRRGFSLSEFSRMPLYKSNVNSERRKKKKQKEEEEEKEREKKRVESPL